MCNTLPIVCPCRNGNDLSHTGTVTKRLPASPRDSVPYSATFIVLCYAEGMGSLGERQEPFVACHRGVMQC